jgi:hypothetical protein
VCFSTSFHPAGQKYGLSCLHSTATVFAHSWGDVNSSLGTKQLVGLKPKGSHIM